MAKPQAQQDAAVDGGRAPEALRVSELGFAYGKSTVWEHVSFTLAPGQVAFLTGSNGAGKSTLLRCVAGRAVPKAGEVAVCGHVVDGRGGEGRGACAFVPDVPALYDDMTAREHIRLIAQVNRETGRLEQGEGLLGEFGLADAADAYPAAFSRGMRQKLALVLALLSLPKVLLLDEPYAPLDPQSRAVLSAQIARAAAAGTAVLASCHHEVADLVPDVLLRLEGGSLHVLGADGFAADEGDAPHDR